MFYSSLDLLASQREGWHNITGCLFVPDQS